ncbi:MAG: transglutaminase family protein, partial [Fulvivirga sp.]|nr:transglutaminase family protein [Fulvivirga sp.]
MKKSELKALISLLDDEDSQVIAHVEEKIISLGEKMIPMLEDAWETNLNPLVQKRIEDLVHNLQVESLTNRLKDWFEEDKPDLLKGMWLVANFQYPDLEFETLKQDLEQLYYDAWLEFKPDAHPYDKIKILNSVLFNKLKFRANTKNFHAPGNSMINVVMQTK